MTPEQKRILVHALKDEGKTVAMTGDGVNDILALKDADCSIAMASGSDAASQVSQLVLLDNDFNKMPSVVMEGRRVVNNIERTASLYLVKNIFSLLLAIFSMSVMLDYPLEPSQVSLISMFTIGIPSFFLALEPNKNQIRGHFLTNVLVKALPAGLIRFCCGEWTRDLLPGVWRGCRVCFNFVYDPCGGRRLYDFIQDRKTNDRTACNSCGIHGDRLAVLHAFCEPFICNHGDIETMCNADGDLCDYYGTGVTVSVDVSGRTP